MPTIKKNDLLISAKNYLIDHPPRDLREAKHAQYEKSYKQ
jgi:hypothetical protein